MKIGVDIMGGDFAPEATVLGAIMAYEKLPENIKMVLIGDEEKIVNILKKEKAESLDFEIVPTSEVIGMGEHPAKTYAKKTDSSIVKGFKLLASKKIDGFASAGNTGAMLVGAMFTIKSIPGVIRPCISGILPQENGNFTLILDVGINPDCRPDILYQYAVLGSVYAENVYNIKNPKIGLLNIGSEEEKGSLLTKATYELMKDTKDFNFIGNVEGNDIFNYDKVNVIICDGFTGNVVLKEAEAFYSSIKKRGISDEYFDRFNFENYGGTPILGINSVVTIGHGISNSVAIKNLIIHTKDIVEAKLSEKIKEYFI
ncbi:MAG: phosphate acyltransferase PlsX [Bacteroidales bacterium]|nr:phosphate acyltransferase PlsX [Bacteroidales bacterium]